MNLISREDTLMLITELRKRIDRLEQRLHKVLEENNELKAALKNRAQ